MVSFISPAVTMRGISKIGSSRAAGGGGRCKSFDFYSLEGGGQINAIQRQSTF